MTFKIQYYKPIKTKIMTNEEINKLSEIQADINNLTKAYDRINYGISVYANGNQLNLDKIGGLRTQVIHLLRGEYKAKIDQLQSQLDQLIISTKETKTIYKSFEL